MTRSFSYRAMTQVSLTQAVCERFPQGSTVTERENLYSKDGVLEVNFTYQTREDDDGKILYIGRTRPAASRLGRRASRPVIG